MALKIENLPNSREQLKKLSLLQVKALRKEIRLKIRKVKPGRGCRTPEFTALKKLNLMLKDEIVDRRIAAERTARPTADVIKLPTLAAVPVSRMVDPPKRVAVG